MRKIVLLISITLLCSCRFQYIRFNSEKDMPQAIRTGNEYHQKLKQNREITNFKLISVEESKLYMGKCNDTLKEVYGLIYEIENNNKTKKVYIRIKKIGTKLDVKTETLF